MNADERRSAFICVHPRLILRLTDAIGVTFPDDDDLAFELVCDGFDRRFVSHERAILFRVTTECHGIFRRIVSSVDPDATLFTKTPSSNSPSGRTKICVTTLDT